ncbi:hypothetical protein K2X89_15950 [Myxococcota bacterium]|nr:hypothetical protein [Myxococcota bacterium]
MPRRVDSGAGRVVLQVDLGRDHACAVLQHDPDGVGNDEAIANDAFDVLLGPAN